MKTIFSISSFCYISTFQYFYDRKTKLFGMANPAARKRIKADRDILLDTLDILRRAAR